MLETDFFKRSRPDFAGLESFGFKKTGDKYTYSEELSGPELAAGQFRAELEVDEEGSVAGRVIDLDTGEEYMPIRFENQVGAFTGTVRETYLAFLEKIHEACFVPVSFMYDQANRIEARINRVYGVSVEFPWEKYPGNGPFRCAENDKWFAAVLTVAYDKLDPDMSDDIVEVINLKADPDDIPELVRTSGVFKAWHMNKKHWISVILNDTLTDDEIFDLINKSYRLVSGSKGSKAKRTGAWMIPSNPKIYDVDAGFRAGRGEIEWHQHNDIRVGDEVFIYSSAPYSAITYRCEVTASDLNYKGMFKDSKGYKRSMRIKLIEKYPPDRYPLSFIKAHGGSVVRSARTMPAELYEAIRAANR